MGSHAGLKKVVKSVRGKKGTVRRTYWVRTKEAVKGAGRFLNKHKGKIAAGAALAGAAYLASKHRGAIKGAYHGARIANKGAGAVSDGMRRVTGHGLGFKNRAKAVIMGARAGSAIGGMSDKGRRVVGAAHSQVDKVRSIPSAIQGGISGARLAGRAGVAVADAGKKGIIGTVNAGRHAVSGIARGAARAVGGVASATPSLVGAGARIGYHANRAKLAVKRAVGRK